MGTPKFRARGFSVVIHNVHNEPEYWTRIVDGMQYDRRVLSFEPYPHQDGHHLHIFTEHKNPCSSAKFFTVLEQAKLGHIEEGDGKGRIQIDSRKGTFQEATAYLTQAETKKEKTCGTPLLHRKGVATCMDCGHQDRDFYMGMSFPNGQFKCYKCRKMYELRDIYCKAYSSALEFKNALDDFEVMWFGDRLRD